MTRNAQYSLKHVSKSIWKKTSQYKHNLESSTIDMVYDKFSAFLLSNLSLDVAIWGSVWGRLRVSKEKQPSVSNWKHQNKRS